MNASFSIKFKEIDPSLFPATSKYDDDGNKLRELTHEEFELEQARLKGKREVRVTIHSLPDDKHCAIVSPMFSPEQKESRRGAIQSLLTNLAYVIRSKVWPLDTMRYKRVTSGPLKGYLVSDGYPGDDPTCQCPAGVYNDHCPVPQHAEIAASVRRRSHGLCRSTACLGSYREDGVCDTCGLMRYEAYRAERL